VANELTGHGAAHQMLKEFAHRVSFAAFIQARSWLPGGRVFGTCQAQYECAGQPAAAEYSLYAAMTLSSYVVL